MADDAELLRSVRLWLGIDVATPEIDDEIRWSIARGRAREPDGWQVDQVARDVRTRLGLSYAD